MNLLAPKSYPKITAGRCPSTAPLTGTYPDIWVQESSHKQETNLRHVGDVSFMLPVQFWHERSSQRYLRWLRQVHLRCPPQVLGLPRLGLLLRLSQERRVHPPSSPLHAL